MSSKDTVGVLSALLDYYSDRATSFASLFVASVFGLVTISALVYTNSANSLWYFIAGIPYFAFVFSGYYTWSRFRLYAGIAYNIEYHGLREPYEKEIEKIHYDIELDKKGYKTDLYEDIRYKSLLARYQPVKKLLYVPHFFAALYSILILTLTIITFWNLIIMYWNSLLDFFNWSNPSVNWNAIVPILALILILIVAVFLWRNNKAKKIQGEKRLKELEKRRQKHNSGTQKKQNSKGRQND